MSVEYLYSYVSRIFRVRVMVFNTTFNNIVVKSWRSVSLAEETGGLGENHRPVASHCNQPPRPMCQACIVFQQNEVYIVWDYYTVSIIVPDIVYKFDIYTRQ